MPRKCAACTPRIGLSGPRSRDYRSNTSPPCLSARIQVIMRSISCIALVFLALTAFAQTTQQSKSHSSRVVWEPPDWNVPQNVKGNGRREMLTSFRVSGYAIVLEQTEMKDVQRRLGGEIGSRETDSSEWLCFHGANETGRWVLWLENDEISESLVGAFQWRQLSESDVLDPRCQSLRREDSMITLPLPFTLGAMESQVLKSLGSPAARDSDRLIYLHEYGSGSYVSSNNVIIRLRNGAVWAIQASKTTSD